MFGFKKWFAAKANYKSLLQKGALIIDVRTAAEFAGGHIYGSRNISLDKIPMMVKDIQKLNRPVITCCKSGGRSAIANRLLQSAAIESYNGGAWEKLQKLIA